MSNVNVGLVAYDIAVRGIDGKPTGIHACPEKVTVPENIDSRSWHAEPPVSRLHVDGYDIDVKGLHYKPTGSHACPEKDTVVRNTSSRDRNVEPDSLEKDTAVGNIDCRTSS